MFCPFLSIYLSLFLSFYDSWTVFLYYIWYNWLDDLCLLVSLSHLLKKLGSSMKNYSIKVKYCERVFWRNKIHSRRLIKFAFNRILVSQYFQLLWIGSNWNSIYVESDHFLFFFYIFLLCTYFLWNISSYSSARSKTIRQINMYLYRLIFFCVTKQHQILYQSSTKLSMFRLNCLCLHCLQLLWFISFLFKAFYLRKGK